MQWVLLAAVVVGFGLLEYRNVRDRVSLSPIRRAVKHEAVRYTTPISAQWERGWWGRGNAKGMQLVVRERSFELSYPIPTMGLLGTEWYCQANDAHIERGQGRFLGPTVQRPCIVLSVPAIDQPNKRQVILLASVPPSHVLHAAWSALVECGVPATGEPPHADD